MPTPPAHDKPLFTPGPLTTSLSVKQAMLRDLGSRDDAFIETVRGVRKGILDVAGVRQVDGYEAILVQGSGTFSIEAVIASATPPDGKLLVIVNGAYGERIVKIARVYGIETTVLRYPENEIPNVAEVRDALSSDPAISMVVTVHCETSSGILNPIEEIGQLARAAGATYFVDSMSAFGGVSFDLAACEIDFLVSSANKCIEGVPGFGFVVCRRDALVATEGWARSLSLDLLAQWKGLESNGQFRFTPPTHAILAFEQALRELAGEGGVEGRAARYKKNRDVLLEGMHALGFNDYVPPEHRSHIITPFHYPSHPNFSFERFYALLNARGFVIYPGKVTNAECFRIGSIGRIFPSDVRSLLAAIGEVLEEMGVEMPKRAARWTEASEP